MKNTRKCTFHIFIKKTKLPKTYNKIWFTRFGSLQLYLSFFKVCIKSENRWTSFLHRITNSWSPRFSRSHASATAKQSAERDNQSSPMATLSGDGVDPTVIPMTSRTYWADKLDLLLELSTAAASMAAR